jgi:hypothetical protein
VSDRWLVTMVGSNSYSIFDMKRHKASTIGLHAATINGIAVSGGRMAVIAHPGLEIIDLATQHRHLITTRQHRNPARQVDDAFLSGGWVGWDDHNGDAHLSNLKTGRTFVIHRVLSSLSKHGAILLTGRGHQLVDAYLANFHGAQRKVLSGVTNIADPQLEGRVLTWISTRHQLEAKVVRLP